MNDYLKLEKIKIRHNFLKLRDMINPVLSAYYSDIIFSKIKKLSIYKNADIIMFYLSCGSEVFTDFAINLAFDDKKTVVVPAVKIHENISNMHAIRITNLKNAFKLVYGIRQPKISYKNIVNKNDINLFFIPAVVFDIYGYRIGYGKGCYDLWLKNVPPEKTIGIAYDFQVINKIPILNHDINVGTVVTNKRLIYVKNKDIIDERE
ncbi:MAG: 5-formyltetrahydrofolate cyclo-ligase [Endomicrobium sp.]|jgi:5-formyltetrahydrofolate cyclo-ligase|nr:5-formyltetrahydrofolate cyclo-ligase [Endomicrobium sp.]